MLWLLSVRRALSNVLALIGAICAVGAAVAVATALDEGKGLGRWIVGFCVAAVASWWAAFRLNRPPRSRAATTGNLVLYETPFREVSLSHTPALTIRGARDAVERFIPLKEFDALFGGRALWRAPSQPTPDMPGEALGVWSRRTCKRFRRILRERGAAIEVRHEAGPEQRIAQLVAHQAPRRTTSSPREPAA